MRTDDTRPRPAGRLRDEASRAWRWANDRPPRARLALTALALAALAGAGYGLSGPAPEAKRDWLYPGHELSSEERDRALTALAVAKIPAAAAARGQIAVPADRRADALAALDKKGLGPRSLGAIRQQSSSSSLFDWPVDRGERADQQREQEAEVLISGFEGIASAVVRINRAAHRQGPARVGKMTVLVSLQLREDGRLPAHSLESIGALLKTIEPDLTPDALTVMDSSGRLFQAAGKPDVEAEVMARARSEDLEIRIKQRLAWIEGVQVFATLEAPPTEAIDEPSPSEAESAPSVVMNAPAEIVEPTAAPPSMPPPPRVKVLVQVPIRHYLRAFERTHRRPAALDELKPYASKVEETIRATIADLAPTGALARVDVVRVDDPGPAPPPAVAAVSDSSRVPSWWLPAGIAGALGFVGALTVGKHWLTKRRPAASPSRAVPRVHFEVGDDAGTSGRVRDLVRRDPAAAAGVLHRWIGQGGHSS